MQIKRIHIKNYRSIKDVDVSLSSMIGFIGRNGAGKSTILTAIQLFYDLSPKLSSEDFYNRETDKNIEFTITFHRFRESELALFSTYLSNNELTVKKIIEWTNGSIISNFRGTSHQIRGFSEIRSIANKADRIKRWKELVESETIAGLKKFSKADDILAFMSEFEGEHPDLLSEMETNVQFFGTTNVGGGRLDNFTKIVFVPAVKDASEEAVDRKGAVAQLLDIIVKRQVESRPEVVELKREFEERIKKVYSSETLTELPSLASDITQVLKKYAPGTELRLNWQEVVPPKLPLPDTIASLVEDGFCTEIVRKGHGLQRVLILSLLQFLASIPVPERQTVDEVESEVSDSDCDLILAIEEPELYQHPLRSRFLIEVFSTLSNYDSAKSNTQIIYTSHSPYFIRLDHFQDIRVVRKSHCNDGCGYHTTISSFSDDEMIEEIRRIDDNPSRAFTGEGFITRASSVMNSIVNEGFFADYAVVVEGNTELAMLWALHDQLGKEWHRKGVAVIPAYGKNNIDRPVIIFRGLGIPSFFIFDGDKSDENNKTETARRNRRLTRLGGVEPLDSPQTSIFREFAVFEDKIESTIEEELGKVEFLRIRDLVAKKLDLSRHTEVLKNPIGASLFIEQVYADNHKLPCLEKIIESIDSFTA